MKTNMLKALLNKRMLIVFLMGFSSGLPLLLIGGTLKAWFTRSGVDLGTIGLFSLVGLPYSLKFVWSLILDRYTPLIMGRRRGWILLTQIGLAAGLFGLSLFDPKDSTLFMAGVALFISFCSASQDIAIDAYRREILADDELGLGNSYAITGYRVAMWIAGGLALILAGQIPWRMVYLTMAVMMGLCVLVTLFADEPKVEELPPRSLKEAFTEPFLEFFRRQGAWWILGFILLYKVGDLMASEMAMPFYIKLGFSETEIGGIVKTFGIWAVMAGGFLGGITMLKIGLRRSLWVFGFLQAVSTLGFAWLAQVGSELWALTVVISFENVTSGMGTAAYAAFMASLTNKRFTATQYALLSSLMGLSRIIAAPTGYMVESMGWTSFFTFCALAALPGMLLLFKIAKWADPNESTPDGTSDQMAV